MPQSDDIVNVSTTQAPTLTLAQAAYGQKVLHWHHENITKLFGDGVNDIELAIICAWLMCGVIYANPVMASVFQSYRAFFKHLYAEAKAIAAQRGADNNELILLRGNCDERPNVMLAFGAVETTKVQ